MSARGVGNAAENKAVKDLESEGYLVERARPDLRWIGPGRCRSMAHDFFETFDLLAIYNDATNSAKARIRLIQITASNAVNERRKKVAAIESRMPSVIELEVWRWRKGRALKSDRKPRGWIKEYYDRINQIWVVFS